MEEKEIFYTVRDVARIFGLHESRIRYWAQTGFINPSGFSSGKRQYNFMDLVGIKAAKELLDRGIALQRVRKNLQALREALPQLDRPLAQLRICSDGEHLVVAQAGGAFDPLSGQLVLDFALDDLRSSVAQIFALNEGEALPSSPLTEKSGKSISSSPGAGPGHAASSNETQLSAPEDASSLALRVALEPSVNQPTSAYGLFLFACKCQHDVESMAAYQKAIELDPSLASAHTNLGNLYYRQGNREKAGECYTTASVLDPEQSEARYNLANLYEEEGNLNMAIAEYRRAISVCPNFADAHFNLALTLEQVGSRVQALEHWQRYLNLASPAAEEEEWRQIACAHLDQLKQCSSDQDTTSSGS